MGKSFHAAWGKARRDISWAIERFKAHFRGRVDRVFGILCPKNEHYLITETPLSVSVARLYPGDVLINKLTI